MLKVLSPNLDFCLIFGSKILPLDHCFTADMCEVWKVQKKKKENLKKYIIDELSWQSDESSDSQSSTPPGIKTYQMAPVKSLQFCQFCKAVQNIWIANLG